MTAEKLINAILNKCEIYYGDALISKEAIIGKYLSFFADSLVSSGRTINFAFHTGSLCFDAISVVAVALGCLSYNLSTNDDIFSSLQINDMVIYKGQRYRWKGTSAEHGPVCIMLEQDGKGRNGKTISYLPAEMYKHLIKPYYGESQITDGRGIRKKNTNREDFLAFAFDVNMQDIPVQIDVSIVIVADRNKFSEIYKQVRIEYGAGKKVDLLDIIPAAYYTGSGEGYQFGLNPAKTEPVLKVTSNISTARDLVLDGNGNKVVGILVIDSASVTENGSEMADLLRRKVLRFAHVTFPIKAGICEQVLNTYEGASVFACTKTMLSKSNQMIRNNNPLTEELHRQIMNVLYNTVTAIPVEGGWDWEEYKNIKNALTIIKQSNWDDASKGNFIVTAYSLLNLLNTAVFPLEIMETAICNGMISKSVTSPLGRIRELWEIADCAGDMQELCMVVADALEQKYYERAKDCPKAHAMKRYLNEHKRSKIAIIVPKSYYAEVLRIVYPEDSCDENIVCVTANRFDSQKKYDAILCVGELNNKRFDPLQCMAARNIDVLLYSCEEKLFSFRRKRIVKYERKLNRRIGAVPAADKPEEDGDALKDTQIEEDVRRFGVLDEYISAFNLLDLRKIAHSSNEGDSNVPLSEVKYIGTFVSGERIFFSKYYSAVVFDNTAGTVLEKAPEHLRPGDVLVFAKRDDYTRNIVDVIYERLLIDGRLGNGAIEAYEKSQYWKEALREYKKANAYSYRKIAEKLREVGCFVQEASVRQWLVDCSHIVGPRKERTMEHIAILTQDPHLLADTHGFFEACGAVRHDRRQILKLIAKAINDKLRGNTPKEGSVLGIVYENVDNLSETLELATITDLDESVNLNVNLVNTPIAETEVLM